MKPLHGILGLIALCVACTPITAVQAERNHRFKPTTPPTLSTPPIDAAGSRETAGWHETNLPQSENLTRYFRYYVPQNLPPNAPVVILFHGGSQSMRKIFSPNTGGSQQWETLAEQEKFLLLVPNGTNPTTGDTQGDQQNWNDCRPPVAGTRTNTTNDDVGFTRNLITWASTHYAIDQKRVYATGASNGGEMAYRVAIELSDQIAAVAAFIANLPEANECQPATHPMPIMMMNGTQDPLMPWDGGTVNGDAGNVLSAQATRDYWLQVNHSNPKDAITKNLPNRDRADRSHIIATLYPATSNGAAVWFYQVEGGGHAMPSIQFEIPQFIQRRVVGPQNHDLEGASAAWKFLRRQSQSTDRKVPDRKIQN